MILRTLLEFAAVVLLIVGFINEKKVIAFENRIFAAIKRKFSFNSNM